MKVRMGFVSNSSSSSFVLLAKNDKLTKEELEKYNNDEMIKMHEEDYKEYYPDNYTKDNMLILDTLSIEYGEGEEEIEKVLKVISKHYNTELKLVALDD